MYQSVMMHTFDWALAKKKPRIKAIYVLFMHGFVEAGK
jgi:hypothetical protein